METRIYSVELEANGYADDTFVSETLGECVTYCFENGYTEGQIAELVGDEKIVENLYTLTGERI